VQEVVDQFVATDASKAIFLTGSIPLGMATHGSDIDLIILLDSRDALLEKNAASRNTNQCLAFSNESEPLRAELFITVMRGVTVEVAIALAPAVKQVYHRLRSKGPELSENEMMTLGRLSTGWLLTQTSGYLDRSKISLTEAALFVYCSTRHFSFALIYRLKAARALELGDIPQALYLGRLSVEMAYLAYFASEKLPYLGAKWLAQIGHARGAAERVQRHPLLREGVPFLFPALEPDAGAAKHYLTAASAFLISMRKLIEQKTLYRIAFQACPQIGPLE
jgi:hypothetical protein